MMVSRDKVSTQPSPTPRGDRCTLQQLGRRVEHLSKKTGILLPNYRATLLSTMFQTKLRQLKEFAYNIAANGVSTLVVLVNINPG